MKKIDLAMIRLKRAFVNLDLHGATRLTGKLNGLEADPAAILGACEEALTDIGDRYAAGEYYIAGLIMAGEIMKRIITLIAPRLNDGSGRRFRDKALIGTVKGDIHDLGKKITGALLGAYGFEVLDLGVDVPGAEFLQAMAAFQPRIVGLSALMSSCFGELAKTVELILRARGASATPFVFVSGACITAESREIFKADYQVDTAFDAVRLCQGLSAARPGLLTLGDRAG